MRTTITLEPDIARKLKEISHLRQGTFKETVNAVLRRGLARQEDRGGEAGERFVVEPHQGGFKPGIDLAKLNQLVDQLEADDFIREAGSKVAEKS